MISHIYIIKILSFFKEKIIIKSLIICIFTVRTIWKDQKRTALREEWVLDISRENNRFVVISSSQGTRSAPSSILSLPTNCGKTQTGEYTTVCRRRLTDARYTWRPNSRPFDRRPHQSRTVPLCGADMRCPVTSILVMPDVRLEMLCHR